MKTYSRSFLSGQLIGDSLIATDMPPVDRPKLLAVLVENDLEDDLCLKQMTFFERMDPVAMVCVCVCVRVCVCVWVSECLCVMSVSAS